MRCRKTDFRLLTCARLQQPGNTTQTFEFLFRVVGRPLVPLQSGNLVLVVEQHGDQSCLSCAIADSAPRLPHRYEAKVDKRGVASGDLSARRRSMESVGIQSQDGSNRMHEEDPDSMHTYRSKESLQPSPERE